jgi:signal transduction histidine kinase
MKTSMTLDLMATGEPGLDDGPSQRQGPLALADGEPGDKPSRSPQSLEAPKHPLVHQVWTLAEHDHRLADLQDANQVLVLAALSAQKLQAVAEQAQRRQTEFLAVLAHELRNPLAPIRTMVALLDEVGTTDPMLPRVRSVIARQVVHMSRLVDDLLDVARITSGKLRIERQSVDLAGVIAQAVDACQPAIDLRLQHFALHVPAGALEMHGDPVRLAQIVTNLLDNASKYTPIGGQIRLSVVLLGATLTLTVSDDGIGIAAEALPEVFRPYVQHRDAIGFNGSGLGLGLAVVRELVEAHGGVVIATSAGNGLGSQFVVTLPLDRRAASGEAAVAQALLVRMTPAL